MGRSKAHKQKREESVFGERLKAIRKSKGLTLMGLAELVGIKHQQLSKLELGETQPTWPTVLRLAETLQVVIDAFR
jgi:transcriptional regulator with XRE-family HTH domain